MNEEWNIQQRGHICVGCQQPFTAAQAYHTLLLFTETGYQRRDLCATCWDNSDPAGAISHWEGVFQLPPPPEQKDAVKKETAESLLRKLMESPDPSHANSRYILAVMLERKRILKPREKTTAENGRRVLCYEHAKTGESFIIPDPGLRLDQLEDTQRQIATLLSPPKAEAPSTMDGASMMPAPETTAGNQSS